MTQQELSKSFKVTVRTVQNWESGKSSIPQPAYKLIRLMAAGKYLGPQWRDFFVHGDTLTTPEGHQFRSGDLAWWSLLIRQADAFRSIMDKHRKAAKDPASETAAPPQSEAGSPTPSERPQMSLAQSLLRGVRSRPSMPAVNPTEKRKDPSSLQVKASGERVADASNGLGGSDSKSLKSKGIPSESLSLTIQERLAETHPASPAVNSRLDREVRS